MSKRSRPLYSVYTNRYGQGKKKKKTNPTSMKKAFIFLILVGIVSCEHESQRFFKPESLNDLDLGNLDAFWGVGVDIDTAYNSGETFAHDPGHIGGTRLYSEDRYIRISVFGTQTEAINAMERMIGTVASIIHEGNTNEIEGIWWFSEGLPNSVFVNMLNTIFQVAIRSSDFESVEEVLYSTANEIAYRIQRQSE